MILRLFGFKTIGAGIASALFVAALTFFGAGAASAGQTPEQFGTPDDLPPPLENICDLTTGAANGLCTAYCEAMDCDSDDPYASDQACQKVSDNFWRLTGGLPPCIRMCPCWAAADLNSVTADNQNLFLSCDDIVDPAFAIIQNELDSTPGEEGGFFADSTGHSFLGFSGCATRGPPMVIVPTSSVEADNCIAQIEDRCAAIGTPIPFP